MTESEEKRMADLEALAMNLLAYCNTLRARMEATDVTLEAFIQGTLAVAPDIKTPFSDALADLSNEREPTVPDETRDIFSKEVDAMAERLWDF